MGADRLRAFQRLEYRDPRPFLLRLRELEAQILGSDVPAKVRSLRTNPLRSAKEQREGALFCYGMAQRIGRTVYMAPCEAQDYDFVACWLAGDTQRFSPVQLKEAVPHAVDPGASVQERVNELTKYVDSDDLTVAIYLNQRIHFDPAKLVVPSLKIGGLWVFGSISDDGKEWGLWGNFLETPEGTRFEYPT
jgi:hypothetical protein